MFHGIGVVSPHRRHAGVQRVLLLEMLRCMMSALFVGNLLIADVRLDLCL